MPVFLIALGKGRPLALEETPLVVLVLGRTELRSGAAPVALEAAEAGRATRGRPVGPVAPDTDRLGAGEAEVEAVPEVPVLTRAAADELADAGGPAGRGTRTEAERGAFAEGAPEMLGRTEEGRAAEVVEGLVAVLDARDERTVGLVVEVDEIGFLASGALVAELAPLAEVGFLTSGLAELEAGVVVLRAGEAASGVLLSAGSSGVAGLAVFR